MARSFILLSLLKVIGRLNPITFVTDVEYSAEATSDGLSVDIWKRVHHTLSLSMAGCSFVWFLIEGSCPCRNFDHRLFAPDVDSIFKVQSLQTTPFDVQRLSIPRSVG